MALCRKGKLWITKLKVNLKTLKWGIQSKKSEIIEDRVKLMKWQKEANIQNKMLELVKHEFDKINSALYRDTKSRSWFSREMSYRESSAVIYDDVQVSVDADTDI